MRASLRSIGSVESTTATNAADDSMAAYVRRLVAGFRPLSAAEKERIGPLLRPGVIAMHRAMGGAR